MDWTDVYDTYNIEHRTEPEFIAGNFAAQLSDDKNFSRSETDKVIEMTLNKESKSARGTADFLTNVDAVRRWEVNASNKSALVPCFQQHVSYQTQAYEHKDLTPSRIAKDEAVITVLTDTFTHPFSEQQTLLSISTGIEATQEVCRDLLNAKVLGKEVMDTFIVERLDKNSEISIFYPIKKMKLSTFSSMNKKKVWKLKGKQISLKSSKDLFCKVTIIAQKRYVDDDELDSESDIERY